MDYRQNYCRNIRYLRRVNHLTQRELAEKLGISVGTLRRIEAEQFPPRSNSRTLNRVCDLFQISSDALLYSDLERQ